MLSLYDRQDVLVEQVSLVLGRNFVLSFQENGTDVFQSSGTASGGKGRLRHARADYLLYALVDAIVDQYFAVLEVVGEKIEALQRLSWRILNLRRCGTSMRSNGSCSFFAAPSGRSAM